MAVEENRWSDWYYVDGGDKSHSIKKKMEEAFTQDSRINQDFWYQAEIDTRFKVGNQAIYNEYYSHLPAHRRKNFYFNRILRAANMIGGYQRRNRKSIIAVPVEEQDQDQSDEITEAISFVSQYNNTNEVTSAAFETGAITTGFSLMQVWMDYTRDPESGDIMIDNVPFNGVLIDPYFKKKDLSDCNYIWRRQWLSNERIAALLPERRDEIMKMRANGNRDGRFQYMAEVYQYDQNNLLTYDEYFYRDHRETTFLIDTDTRQVKEWRGNDENLEEFQAAYPQIAARKAIVPTVRLAIAVDGEPMYDGPNPLEMDSYPFVGVFGYFEPSLPYIGDRMQGVVRNLRDAQFLYNRRKVIELDILESQITSGMKFKVDSLVDPEDIHLVGQGKHLAMKKNADMADVQQFQAPQIPPTMMALSEALGKEITEISGVNEELLGSAADDKAGILAQLRQGAGLTTLQGLFDQFDSSMKQLGKIYSELIQRNFSYGKMRAILGRNPSPLYNLAPEDRYFSQYDIRIEEGVSTTTQKQLQLVQLIHLRELGIPIPSAVILDAVTVQNKNELIEAVQAEEQANAQSQQVQMQQQMAMLQAQIDSLQARALADTGLGVERTARISENAELAVERRAKAIEDLSDAQLNRAKTLAELQNMDLDQIQKLLAMAEMLKPTQPAEGVEDAVRSPVLPQGQRIDDTPQLFDMGPGLSP